MTGRYDSFCALSDEARAAWLGWAIARTIQPLLDGHDGADFLDHLGTKLGIDVAAWWRPTALTYFDRLTKPAILALFEEIGGADLSSRYAGSRKHDLAASAERVFAGDAIMDAEVKARAIAWLPDAMKFNGLSDAFETVGEAGIAHHVQGDVAGPSIDLPEAA